MAASLSRALVYTHRWLGITGCVLFIAWFVSGVVMMYARMPGLQEEERLVRAAALDLSALRVSAADAAHAAGISPDRVRVGMLDGRAIYRLAEGRSIAAVFADSGEPLQGFSQAGALRAARAFMPEHASTIAYDAYLTEPDQWTLYSRQFLPMHRIDVGDADGSHVYLSDRSGEPVMKTTRQQRLWGYLGPVVHWGYFTPLRQNTALWRQIIIGLSLAGCMMCLTGIAWGLWRFSTAGRYRIKGTRSRTPYAGWMRWHHYAGLIFGLVTFTWILSGFFSMSPWEWSPGSAPSASQRRAVAGGPLRLDLVTPDALRRAAAAMDRTSGTKELELVQVAGEPSVLAYRTPARDVARWNSAYFRLPQVPEHRFVSLVNPARGVFTRFEERVMEQAARAAMPGVAIAESTWLHGYDAYYYDKHYARSLPVLRVRFADPGATWLYLDPARGSIALTHGRLSRAERWLYHGLHSLDFPSFYQSRPLWDALLILFSIGGTVLSITTLLPAWRRVTRHTRRAMSPKGRALRVHSGLGHDRPSAAARPHLPPSVAALGASPGHDSGPRS